MMKTYRRIKMILATTALTFALLTASEAKGQIPLPEHPRPDFERTEWQNLNGLWDFSFNGQQFNQHILVPFGWGSPASGIADGGDIGWYKRDITIPESWQGKRIFLVVGASDWETQGWLNGKELGKHQGGYTPFEFELTDAITAYGQLQQLLLRADDTPNNQHITGKQGYGNVRGIWQTVYLEARGQNYIDYVHFTPDIDRSTVKVEVALKEQPAKNTALRLHFENSEQADVTVKVKQQRQSFEVKLSNQHLWDLDDPYLYHVKVSLEDKTQTVDQVQTYFGQRKVSVVNLPDTDYPYVALNNKPIYLQLTLDQSYHPDGYYTFPSDEIMRNEILISKRLGLNGNRIHIKVEVPRKLYWADRLGLLIMADTPNWWDDPKAEGKADWEHAMRGMVKRDYNHPSIFSWVNFNETWGLFTPWEGQHREFKKDTQEWVRQMYRLTKNLDPSRLVEDMSPCNYDHVESDINSWHAYLPGHAWERVLDENCQNTYPGSQWNYTKDNLQRAGVPMMNSECGNVWGYEGSTGDVDITWDYHQMMNAYRAHPKCAGWLYTEHHDVINEWNGYVRFDRSEKESGLSDFVPGMSMADFHSPYYVSPRCDLMQEVKAGSQQAIPLFLSVMTDRNPGQMTLETSLAGWDALGLPIQEQPINSQAIPFEAYKNAQWSMVNIQLPKANGLYVVRFVLRGENGQVLHRNFVLYRIKDDTNLNGVTFAPNSFIKANWTLKQWTAMDGKKMNGAGDGFFEYEVQLPADLGSSANALLVFEASAKQLFGKDMEGSNLSEVGGDFMRGKGTLDPCRLPNAYAQTDGVKHPSMVRVIVNGEVCGTAYLPDDPADHRGALSWYAQGKTNKLNEAGSYGYRIEVSIPKRLLQAGQKATIRFEVPEGTGGGLALYSEDAGRYPMNPTLIFQ